MSSATQRIVPIRLRSRQTVRTALRNSKPNGAAKRRTPSRCQQRPARRRLRASEVRLLRGTAPAMHPIPNPAERPLVAGTTQDGFKLWSEGNSHAESSASWQNSRSDRNIVSGKAVYFPRLSTNSQYPLGESNPCLRTENPMSWATRRRGLRHSPRILSDWRWPTSLEVSRISGRGSCQSRFRDRRKTGSLMLSYGYVPNSNLGGIV